MYIKINKHQCCIVMNKSFTYRIMIISLVLLLFESSCIPYSKSQLINQASPQPQNVINGKILFAPMNGRITYLIDSSGSVVHTWSSDYLPGEAVIWLGNGTILRTIKVGMVIPLGAGGGVQKISWDGTILWDFRYNSDGHLSHHDVKSLPNGNILLIAWETKTRDEAISAGRNPSYINGNTFMPDHIIEVKPTGPTTGDIVWEARLGPSHPGLRCFQSELWCSRRSSRTGRYQFCTRRKIGMDA
jgi:hypothetical protein